MNAKPWVSFLAGFAIAIFAVTELHGFSFWPIVTFVCGLVARYVVMQVIVQPMFGNQFSLAQHWAKRHPLQALFWKHAHAFGRGHHPEKDPRNCQLCRVR